MWLYLVRTDILCDPSVPPLPDSCARDVRIWQGPHQLSSKWLFIESTLEYLFKVVQLSWLVGVFSRSWQNVLFFSAESEPWGPCKGWKQKTRFLDWSHSLYLCAMFYVRTCFFGHWELCASSTYAPPPPILPNGRSPWLSHHGSPHRDSPSTGLHWHLQMHRQIQVSSSQLLKQYLSLYIRICMYNHRMVPG